MLHHVSTDLLRESYYALKRKAAPGVDGETWEEYGHDLEKRLADLHDRVHRGAYRASPSRRTYIAKADGRQRPLGVAAIEDKVLQQAMATVLQQIYEEDFRGFSYGSRPKRGAHDALDALWVGLMGKKVNWVLDADMRGFFDTLEHGWLLKFLEHRIADRRVLRLIRKWLKAGVLEEGEWSETEEGTPQGAVISPLLANVYLHYVLDLWVGQWRKRHATGDVIVVRYVDDFVLGFQHREEADRFLDGLKERVEKFGLALHPEKTRLIEFGRFAAENRKERGLGKPETFDFLGFTHYCGKQRKTQRFTVQRKTIAKRQRAKLKIVRTQLKRRRHRPVAETGAWLRALIRGYMNYHGVPGNWRALEVFRREINRAWLFAIRRRSQKHRMPWARFNRTLVNRWIPRVRITHPYPDARFAAKHPR
jgi:group II intron reverse transcriptase/maturase